MATTVTGTVISKKTPIGIALAVFSLHCSAGELTIQPALTLTETYTDNINLSRSNKTDSVVSQYAFELAADYQAQYANFTLETTNTYATYSHDHDLDKSYHELNAAFNVMLFPNGITWFGQFNVDNRSRNDSRNSLADIVSADTVRVENYASGFSYNVDNSDFKIESSIAYSQINTEDDIGERDGYSALLLSENGSAARNVFWNADGNFQDFEDDDRDARYYSSELKIGWISSYGFNPFVRYFDEDNQGSASAGRSLESNSIGLGIRWLVTKRLLIDLSYNDPVGSQFDLDGNELSKYWDAFLNWQPSKRTQLQAQISQRFYGDSYFVSFQHKIRKLESSVSYNEQVTTFTRNNLEPFLVGSYWCPSNENIDLNQCYVQNDQNLNFDDLTLINVTDFNILEDQQFNIDKTFTWKSSYKHARSSFDLDLARTEREALNTQIKDKYQSARLSYTRKVSGRSTITLSAIYNVNTLRVDNPDERKDTYRNYDLEYKKSLNSELSVKFNFSHLNRDSNIDLYNYEEQRVYLTLTKEF